MSSHLPSPPSSHTSSPEPTAKPESGEQALSRGLDSLLIEYLSLLDTYTNLRAQLSKTFSCGFFALAQANRNANSTLGAGRRYGEEGYDERMKAGRVVRIQQGKQAHGDEYIQEDKSKEKEQVGEQEEEKQPPLETTRTGPQEKTPAYNYTIASSSEPTKDPTRWYGILIPPALRTCQGHFTSAISSSIPDLLNTTAAMCQMEQEIWSIRQELGINDDYQSSDDAALQVEKTIEEDVPSQIPLANLSVSQASSNTSPTRMASSLLSTSPSSAGLPTEPRSRVLKLG